MDEFTFPADLVGPHISKVCDTMIQFGDTVRNIEMGNGTYGEEFVLDAVAGGDAIAELLNVLNDYMESVGPLYLAFKGFFDGLHGGEDNADSPQ